MNEISKDELIRGLLTEVDLGETGAMSAPVAAGVIAVYKEWGKTPLECLDALRQKYPTLKEPPLSYAGRLDPLAEGLTLVLVGETNKDREQYLHLDKTYEVEILLGFKTDTGDLFGVPAVAPTVPSVTNISEGDEATIKKLSNSSFINFSNEIKRVCEELVGKQQFPYPVYSSKTVQGKPLFQWMNEGRISEIEIPKTDVEIYSIELLNNGESEIKEVSGSEILEKVELALKSVKGDFRYDEIRAGWNEVLKDKSEANFGVIKIECECSSGTYMRVLAEEIGEKMRVPALAYSIKRVKVGILGLDSAILSRQD